jgi:hypothetical protein
LIGFHFFRRRLNWALWDVLHQRQRGRKRRGSPTLEAGLAGWESRQAALMQGRNPYAVPKYSQLSPKDSLSARGTGGSPTLEAGLPGWESRQAALTQGRNPYVVPEHSQLSPKDSLSATGPEGKHLVKAPSLAGDSLEGDGPETMLRETRRSGRKSRLFWTAVVSAAAAIIVAAFWAFWRARN